MARNTFRLINWFILKHRLLIFMSLLLTLLLIFPFIHQLKPHLFSFIEILFSCILVAGIYIVSSNRKVLTIAILLGIMTGTIIWFNIILKSHALILTGLICEIIFFAITTITIISHVLTYKRVSADKIYGAICAYLLIGVIWALIYSTIETAFPGSFEFRQSLEAITPEHFMHPFYFIHFVYYSFITLTTTGYGDVIPTNSIARAFSAIEAMIGQLYVAVLIARLVGLHISHTTLKISNIDKSTNEK